MTHPAAMDESKLLAECQVRRQRRAGPGGQHRNKVETAIVITHAPTGVRGEASERRSQEENRRRALFRLRVNLALAIRDAVPPAPGAAWSRHARHRQLAVSVEHADFPVLLAEALDVLHHCGMDAKRAADYFGCSPSQLIKLLRREPRALEAVNRQRGEEGKPAYR